MNAHVDPYDAFLRAKAVAAPVKGVDVPLDALSPRLIRHQPVAVRWALMGGCRAIFASFGLGKTVMQLEILHQIVRLFGGKALLVAPYGVHGDIDKDSRDILGRPGPVFIQSTVQAMALPDGVYLTNYEPVRDGKLDLSLFIAVSLDEADCLRGMGGSKTFRSFMTEVAAGVRFKFVASATPSPNEYIELLAYAAFLGVMDIGQAKTRFFQRDSEKADKLTLYPHKEEEFWLWVATWALFIDKPSDLGFSDDGYELPPLDVRWHEVRTASDLAIGEAAGFAKDGQGLMFRETALGVMEAAAEKRRSLAARVAKMSEILAGEPDEPHLLWHDLEDERRAIEAAVPTCVSVFGTQSVADRARAILNFADGWFQHLAAKPVLAGAGCNFQRHCARAIFVGVGFKFRDFIQAVHRIQRFLQARPVVIHIIHAASERPVVKLLMEKWARHDAQRAKMSQIIKEYGLTEVAMMQALERSLFDPAKRVEVRGAAYRLANNDCVAETRAMEEGSVDLIVTSIPFSTQYEYTPSFNDFGHTETNEQFWKQMGFLIPQLLKVLAPGRVAAIHVKDRIVPGGLTGLGFQTVYSFADDCRAAFQRAGFAYIGRSINLTDVVRENNQTYRLGHSEQLKDGSRMGNGLPEEVLYFRKPQTDRSKGYADVMVEKSRPDYVDQDGRPAAYSRAAEVAGTITPVPGTGYSRGRWQIDAHALHRSSGDRLIAPHEWAGFDAQTIYRAWKAANLSQVYDFEHHVRIAEELTAVGRLPPTFALIPAHSWHEDVWSDTAQMLSLNSLQAAAGAEKHLCPLPFDIVDRAIARFSMPGEVVFDPFAGLMTVPYRAVKLGRRGIGVELNPGYFLDGCKYVEAAARDADVPTLFDLTGDRGEPDDCQVHAGELADVGVAG